MNFIQRENLRLFLDWQKKWHEGFVGREPWLWDRQVLFDVRLERKRVAARAWLAQSVRWTRKNGVVPFRRRGGVR